jgi:hypothetical protein
VAHSSTRTKRRRENNPKVAWIDRLLDILDSLPGNLGFSHTLNLTMDACLVCCQSWRINKDSEIIGNLSYKKAVIMLDEAGAGSLPP